MRSCSLLVAVLCSACATSRVANSNNKDDMMCVLLKPATREDSALVQRGDGALEIRVSALGGGYQGPRGLRVTAEGDTTYRQQFSFDASGRYTPVAAVSFSPMRPGRYRIEAVQLGYYGEDQVISIAPGRRDTVEFKLRPHPASSSYGAPPDCLHPPPETQP